MQPFISGDATGKTGGRRPVITGTDKRKVRIVDELDGILYACGKTDVTYFPVFSDYDTSENGWVKHPQVSVADAAGKRRASPLAKTRSVHSHPRTDKAPPHRGCTRRQSMCLPSARPLARQPKDARCEHQVRHVTKSAPPQPRPAPEVASQMPKVLDKTLPIMVK